LWNLSLIWSTGLDSYDKVLKLFSIARAEFGETLSSFELLDNTAVTFVESKLHLSCPITNVHPFYVLIELASSQPTVGQHLENVLEKALGDSVISDATTTDQMSSIQVTYYTWIFILNHFNAIQYLQYYILIIIDA